MTAEEHFDAALPCELQGEYAAAIEHLTNAIELEPHFPEAFFNRAGAWELQGQIDAAIRDYEMAIEQDPTTPDSYLCLARLYLNEEDAEHFCAQEAAPLAEHACHLTNHQSFEALATAAKAYAAMGRYRAAANRLGSAIAILSGSVKVDSPYVPPVDGEVWLDEMRADLKTYRAFANNAWWRRLGGMFRDR
jgi:tetratricopeptide (TPR) repeat protein